MGLVNFAEKELERIGSSEDEMQKLMNENILEIVKTFSEQGHSGFSAGYALNLIKRLLAYKPISPLTGEDDEWNEVGENKYQNKRRSTVFKDGKDNQAYDIEGIIFTRDGGDTWFTNKDSRAPVTFPYNVPEEPERVYLEEEGSQ